MDPEILFDEMASLLKRNFQHFKLKKVGNELVFYRKYELKNLAIEIHTCILDNGLLPRTFDSRKKILFKILQGDKACLEIRASRIAKGWQKVMFDKIETLELTVSDIPTCSKCHVYYYPTKAKTFKQGNPKGTKFVWFNCPKCQGKEYSTFGIYLKTKLHAYLD